MRWRAPESMKMVCPFPIFRGVSKVILVAKSKSGEICHENRLFLSSGGEYRPSFVFAKDRTSLRKATSPPVSKVTLLGNFFKLQGKAVGRQRRVWELTHPHRAMPQCVQD